MFPRHTWNVACALDEFAAEPPGCEIGVESFSNSTPTPVACRRGASSIGPWRDW
jgi:hypothetical protein